MKRDALIQALTQTGDELRDMAQRAGKTCQVPTSASLQVSFRQPELMAGANLGPINLAELTRLYYLPEVDLSPSRVIRVWNDTVRALTNRTFKLREVVDAFKGVFPDVSFSGSVPEVMAQYLWAAQWVAGRLEFIQNGVVLTFPNVEGDHEIGFDHRTVRLWDDRRPWSGPTGSCRPALRKPTGALLRCSNKLACTYAYLLDIFPGQADALRTVFAIAHGMGRDGEQALVHGAFDLRVIDKETGRLSIWDKAREVVLKAKHNPACELHDMLRCVVSPTTLDDEIGVAVDHGGKYSHRLRSKHLTYIERQAAKYLLQKAPTDDETTAQALLDLHNSIR